jgi:hypothetical protein
VSDVDAKQKTYIAQVHQTHQAQAKKLWQGWKQTLSFFDCVQLKTKTW